MPMIPSPIAAITYASLKVVGYAIFAKQLNNLVGANVSPKYFGFVKTVAGTAGGLATIFFIAPMLSQYELPEALLLLPLRMVVWFFVLAMFYSFRQKPMLMPSAVAAGTALSYAIDLVMWVLYKILPGMEIGFC